MGLKKLFIVLSITIGIIFGLMLGSSYAWYAYSNAESTLFGRILSEKPTIIFAQDDSVVFRTNMPILDSDRYLFANITSFNVTFENNFIDYETAMSIYLDDIIIDDELISDSFKYELMENGTTIASGSFMEYQKNGSFILMPSKIIDNQVYPATYVYDLFVWISDDGTNQNNLMGKTFSAKVKVDNAMKRK